MPKLKSYGVFISHAWDYNADYYRLVDMLDKQKRFKWRNCSVPEHDPRHAKNDAELEKALRYQIQPANAVLIISGMYAKHRKWIRKEIAIAEEMKKQIIPVIPWGAKKIPNELKKYEKNMVHWDTLKIVDKIRQPTSESRRRFIESIVNVIKKPPQPKPSQRIVGSNEKTDSVLLDWIRSDDDSTNYDVYVSGKTVKMRGGVGG